jgi:NitT/TauT family transport system substrate-binding protein
MRIRTSGRWAVAGVLLVPLLAACGGDDSGGGDGGDQVKVVAQSLDAGSNGPFIAGTAKGFFEDEGVEVEVGFAEDPIPALVSGSAGVGILELPYLAQAVDEGVDLVAFAGYRCVEPFYIAVSSDIKDASDLEGKNIFLDGLKGAPPVDLRLDLMKQAGWDLSDVDVNLVQIPGDSAGPVEQFAEGQLDATIFYREEYAQIKEADGQVVVTELRLWPNEVMVAERSWLEENPELIENFLKGMLNSAKWFKDLSHRDEFLDLAKKQDYPTKDAESDYESGPYLFCENLYLEPESANAQLETYEAPGNFTLDDLAVLDHLEAAQKSVGMDNAPPPPLEGTGLPE